MLKLILNTFAVKLFLAGIRLIMNIALARLLGPELRGLYYVIQNIVGFTASLSTLSIGEAYIYFHGKNRLGVSSMKLFSFVATAVGGFVALTLLAIIFSSPIQTKIDNEQYFIPSLALCIALIYEYFVLQELKARYKIERANIYYALSKLFLLCMIIAEGDALSPVDVVLLNIVAVGFLIVSLWIPTIYFSEFPRSSWRAEVRADAKRVKEYLEFSAKAHLGTMLNLAEYRLDGILAAFFIDLRLLGIYSVVLSVGQINYYIINSVNTVLFPNFVRGNMEFSDFTRAIRFTLIPIIFVTGCLAVAVDAVDHLIFGEGFSEVGKYFIWTIPMIVLESFNRLAATLFKVNNALSEFNKISILSLLLYLPALVLLGILFGLYGLILASTISYCFRSILFFKYMKNTYPDDVFLTKFIPDLRELRDYVRQKNNA